MSKAHPDPARAESFREIAQLIAGPEAPQWLPEHLSRWAPCIFLASAVEDRQPSRSAMRRLLGKIRDAALLLTRALGQAAIREFLEAAPAGPMENIGSLDQSLRDLAGRADRASKAPSLVNEAGKTKAGRGRAAPPGAISAQTYCALLIAETWKYFHDRYPAPRNRQAAAAAGAYWRAAGGEQTAWGDDPLNAWRHHFEKARAAEATEGIRAEHWRHLKISARLAQELSLSEE